MLFDKISGRGYLAISILIFAASSAVTSKLIELGAQNLVNGRNPISFCNLLFVGNVWALIALVLIYGRSWSASCLQRLSTSDWLSLVAVAIFSGALAPALTFFALETTAVNNVILIGRVEPPLSLALSVLLLKETVNRWIVLGAIIAFIGVALTIFLQSPPEKAIDMGNGVLVGRGELIAAGGALSLAIANVISKAKLEQIPLGIFTIFRTALGTVIFAVAVVKLFGIAHFQDVLAPVVWRWTLIYALIIVVVGQLTWFQGLKQTTAGEVSLFSSVTPVIGIIAAYIILGEVPTIAQYIGGAVIIMGIILNQYGISRLAKSLSDKPEWRKQSDRNIGFKGI